MNEVNKENAYGEIDKVNFILKKSAERGTFVS
jgi:hypothetical protein